MFRLLRDSHIFASVVREVVEAGILQDLSPAELTPSQLHLLRLLTATGRRPIGEAADCLRLSSAATTKNVDKLERMGLLTRTNCPDDRRATLLSASDSARRLITHFDHTTQGHLAQALDEFTAADVTQLCDFLERLSLALLNSDQQNDRCCLRCAAYVTEDCPIGRVRDGCPYRRSRPPTQDGGDT